METVLAGDIGGTNARFVLFQNGQFNHASLHSLPVSGHKNLADTIADYLTKIDCDTIDKIALSAATTARYEDEIELTNCEVRFSVSGLVERFRLQSARVINDFTAAALGVVSLPAEHLQLIHKGMPDPIAPRAVLGPGTGLGVSGLVYSGSHWIPLQGQGGHVTSVVQSQRELAINKLLAEQFGHVSAERYLSGSGTISVYKAVCQLDGLPLQCVTPAEISANAIAGKCPACVEVMQLFCKLLGVVAGNLALTLGASGGIYITGGIVPRLGEFFLNSNFLQELHNKGRFSSFVTDMPVWLVNSGEPALYGAYQSLDARYNQFGHSVQVC